MMVELVNLVTNGPTGPVDSNWKNHLVNYQLKVTGEFNWTINYQLISTGVIPVDFNRSDSR